MNLRQSLLFVAILLGSAFALILIYYLTPVLTPFLIAGALAYLTDPLVEKMSQKWKLPRTLAVILVFIAVLLVFIVILFSLIPALQQEFMTFVSKLPAMGDWLQQILLPRLVEWDLVPDDFSFDSIRKGLTEHVTETTHAAKWMGQALFRSGLTLVTWILNLLIIFVATFYLLRDWQRILLAGKSIIPRKFSPKVIHMAQQCDVVLATFVRGQLSIMAVLGVFYSVGLALIGVNFALLLGMMAGILSIVPYLGSMIGLGAALIAAWAQFHTILPIIAVLALFAVGHVIEGMVLAPLLIGDKLGLHPVVVIFAVLAGGHLLGFVGVLLALPLTAILAVFVRELLGIPASGK